VLVLEVKYDDDDDDDDYDYYYYYFTVQNAQLIITCKFDSLSVISLYYTAVQSISQSMRSWYFR